MTDKGRQSLPRKPVRAPVPRKPKSGTSAHSVIPEAYSELQVPRIGKRVLITKTGTIGKVTSVVTDQDGVVVNECKINGFWYSFSELSVV